MNEQTTIDTDKIPQTNWLDEEAKQLESNKPYEGEKLPALKFEEKKVAGFDVDFSEPFNSYTPDEKTHKKIIPVTHEGIKKIWWLNTKNPVYKDIILKGQEGQTHFKLLQSGKKEDTRYTLVED